MKNQLWSLHFADHTNIPFICTKHYPIQQKIFLLTKSPSVRDKQNQTRCRATGNRFWTRLKSQTSTLCQQPMWSRTPEIFPSKSTVAAVRSFAVLKPTGFCSWLTVCAWTISSLPRGTFTKHRNYRQQLTRQNRNSVVLLPRCTAAMHLVASFISKPVNRLFLQRVERVIWKLTRSHIMEWEMMIGSAISILISRKKLASHVIHLHRIRWFKRRRKSKSILWCFLRRKAFALFGNASTAKKTR